MRKSRKKFLYIACDIHLQHICLKMELIYATYKIYQVIRAVKLRKYIHTLQTRDLIKLKIRWISQIFNQNMMIYRALTVWISVPELIYASKHNQLNFSQLKTNNKQLQSKYVHLWCTYTDVSSSSKKKQTTEFIYNNK